VHLQPELKSGEVGEFFAVVRRLRRGFKGGRVRRRHHLSRHAHPKAGGRLDGYDAVQVGMEDASRKSVIDFAFHAGLTFPTTETIAEIPQLVAMGYRRSNCS